MDYDWPDWKSEKCRAERGFDFAYAIQVFDGPTIEFVDDRKPYPERRIIAFGVIEGLRYAVVFFDSDEAGTRFILSARRAREHEVQKWLQREGGGRSEPGTSTAQGSRPPRTSRSGST